METIVLVFTPTGKVTLPKALVQHPRGTPNASDSRKALGDGQSQTPFWTWFIENPRISA